MPANDEKMWYSIKEAATYLNIEQDRVLRKLYNLNMETRTLPGTKGEYISKRDLLLIEQDIKHPGSV
jgi:hypothetical protein